MKKSEPKKKSGKEQLNVEGLITGKAEDKRGKGPGSKPLK